MDELLLGFEDALITQGVAYRYAFAKKADIQAVTDLFAKELTKFPKGHCWWDPPHNLGINQALMGINLWEFGILPGFPHKTAYWKGDERYPEGLVVHPSWHPITNNALTDDDVKVAEKLIKLAKAADSVQNRVKEELKKVEAWFSVKVPSGIESKLVAESVKIASRRWGVNHLKMRDTLIPFDGSKAVEISRW
jgi:hypothetical protein